MQLDTQPPVRILLQQLHGELQMDVVDVIDPVDGLQEHSVVMLHLIRDVLNPHTLANQDLNLVSPLEHLLEGTEFRRASDPDMASWRIPIHGSAGFNVQGFGGVKAKNSQLVEEALM